ncbi:hypothetical protein EDB83DRAFT_2439815 [Lactarius deliciosus]|nr:hypothetical protein EDB83DRAFT_2439815 [Lactarius deliciosus]
MGDDSLTFVFSLCILAYVFQLRQHSHTRNIPFIGEVHDDTVGTTTDIRAIPRAGCKPACDISYQHSQVSICALLSCFGS